MWRERKREEEEGDDLVVWILGVIKRSKEVEWSGRKENNRNK